MEPMGPVIVCVHAGAVRPRARVHTHTHYNIIKLANRPLTMDNDWHVDCNVWVAVDVIDRHITIFKSRLSFHQETCETIYVQNNNILWKSHSPPAILFESIKSRAITAVACVTFPEKEKKKGSLMSRKQCKLAESNAGCWRDTQHGVFVAAGLELSNWLWECFKIWGRDVKEFQVGSNVQIPELT